MEVDSEEIYKIVVEEASILAALYTGPEIRIRIANKLMLQAWGKDESVIGKTIREANPEWEGQPFFDYFDNVFKTGIEYVAIEERADLLVNGAFQTFYYNFNYKPLRHADGTIWGIVHTAFDVTEQVQAKKRKERADEMFRQAVSSADLGTWYMHVATREIIASDRAKELFGYKSHDVLNIDTLIDQIPEEYRTHVMAAFDAAFTGENYDIEYPIIGYNDKKLRWVRATGKLYEAVGDQPSFLAGTLLDIMERKEKELRKDDFISIASHELKTPITTLKGSLQLLERMKDDPSKIPPLIERSTRSIGKICKLIDDLLNVSRMNQSQLELNKTPFIIGDMLHDCCNHVRIEGKHELVLEGDIDLEICADEHRLDQVVVNMVSNAVKYAPLSEIIYVQVEKAGDMVKVSVKDKGPGIPPERLQYLFDRYYQAENSKHYSGLGLGLYISSEIIKRHGGEIGVQSELGKGSTFWFTVPVR